MDPGAGNNGDPTTEPHRYAVSGKIMLTAIVAMFSTVLILFLHLYLRWRFHRLSYRRRIRRSRHRGRLVFAGESARLAPSTVVGRGLDPAVLKSLPVIVFSVGDEEKDKAVAECPVCLSQFEEGEKLRCLPRCGHCFHIDCIDMWFHSHATCPLCRATVEAAAAAPSTPKAIDPVAPPVAEQPPSPATGCFPPEGFLPPFGEGEEEIGSSAPAELRIEIPSSGLSAEEPGLGLKSPGSHRLLLRRILSGNLRLYRCGIVSATKSDLEQGEMAEQLPSPSPPPPPPPPPPPLPHPAESMTESSNRCYSSATSELDES